MNARPRLSAAIRVYWLWPVTLLVGLVVLALSPGGFAEKSRLLVHGLCAQTPSHTYAIGGQPLPFDARMTGIYAGVLGTLVLLAVRRRIFAQELPSKAVLAVLVLFVGVMGLDGTNSLLTDLGVWHPWDSTNMTRVITGYFTGITMAAALVWLFSGTVFQVADRRQVIASWRELLSFLAPLPVLGVMLWWQPSWLYVPISIALVLSAWIVLGTLALVTVLLASRIDERIVQRSQLHLPGAIGLVLGLGIMIALALGRQWLERTMGIPSNL